ncbi:helix-turn-helix domain-containing protein [Leucobacter sp. G161]|uniref:helix-turn-helix domain-containing protein n=1 Tax=Leucobacter sp. G161 TaxID=663704 RepID=UPI003510A837
MYVSSGWSRLSFRGAQVAVGPGDLILIPNETLCAGEPLAPTRTLTLYMRPEFVSDHARWLPQTHPLTMALLQSLRPGPPVHFGTVNKELSSSLAQSMASLSRLSLNQETLPKIIVGAAQVFADLFLHLSGPRPADQTKSPGREVLRAIDLLGSHIERPWDVRHLANEVALSSAQLTRLFRKETGLTPARFLRILRAKAMAERLVLNDDPISLISAQIGWSTPEVASRAFRAYWGVSPSSFRAAARLDENLIRRRF